MKVRSKKDTVTGLRTIKIIDQLSISTNYNLAADSLRWSPISVTGNTPILKNTRILIFQQHGIPIPGMSETIEAKQHL